MDSIGKQLASARRRKGLDLKEVEEATKIRLRFLEALEKNEFDVLPGPTYVKGFIRSYASYLKVDHKPLVEEYKKIQPSQDVTKTESVTPTFDLRRRGGKNSSRRFSVPAALLTIIFLMTVFLTYLGYQDTIQSKRLASGKYVKRDLKRLENERKAKKKKKHKKKKGGKTDLFVIKVVATRNTWVSVKGQSKPFFNNFIKPKKSQTFISRKPLEVTAGKGSYVRVYLDNRYVGRIAVSPTIASRVFKK